MKIAIPVWDGKVSPVFDTAARLLILHVEDSKEVSRIETYLDEKEDLARRCFRVQELDVDTLICGAISRHFQRILDAGGITVIPWISGATEEVLTAYLDGDLFHPRFLMPGCSRHVRKKRRSDCTVTTDES